MSVQALKLVNIAFLSHTEWLEWRRKGIGGSDAAAVVGVSRWKSPVAVWMDKTGQIEHEEAGEAAYFGNLLEEVVAREFMTRTGLKVRKNNNMLQHPDHPFMMANVDREIVGQRVGLECKTTSIFNKDEWLDDKVPDAYYIQCQHYMAVTGYTGWWIACLIGGNQFVHKLVSRDDELIDRLIQIEKDFWDHVVNGTMPAVDGSDDSAQALKKLYPDSNGQEIILPDTAELWIKQYESASEEEKAAKERKQEAQNVLQNMLGPNECGKVGGRVVSWKSTKGRETFDKDGLKKDNYAIFKQYVKQGEPSRRFSVK